MTDLFKIAKIYQKKLAAIQPVVEMAVTFGRVMGPLLGLESDDVADMVLADLERAGQEDLKEYSLSAQKRIAELYKHILRQGANEYANDEKQRQTQEGYDMEESLSWIAQEVMAKARGTYDNERKFGPEGRYL